jgi:hypothetical protein
VIPAKLWAPQAFHTHERNDYMGQSIYFGLVIGMGLFNLLLFLVLRDVTYLLYVAFVTCSTAIAASQSGLLKEFMWPTAGLWSDISTSVAFSFGFAAILLFMRQMLDTKKVRCAFQSNPSFDPSRCFTAGWAS